METITLKFIGNASLLMHSERSVDPLDAGTKALKKLTAVKKKTDEMHEQIARAEWELGMYFDPEMGPKMPTANIIAAIAKGGVHNRLGKDLKRAILPAVEFVRLDYKGQRDLVGMWKSQNFRDRRSVGVGPKRVMRTRPKFAPPWSFTCELMFDTTVIDAEALIDSARLAGRLVGIGDYRPDCGGPFGRFDVEVLP